MAGSVEDCRTLEQEQAVVDRFFRVAFIAWLVLIFILIGISCWSLYATQVRVIEKTAFDSYLKDMAYRHWATQHGGVYVPVTPETQSNPYLAHLPERDIVTPSGKKLTLVNPAYMNRQVHELSLERYGLRGHLTSLKPIYPANKPDAWEQKALLLFEKGVPEVFERSTIDGKEFYRYMRPFITEQGCLKCHADQGYKKGDIRGGISVSIPWEENRNNLLQHMAVIFLAYACVGIVGLWSIYIARKKIYGYLSDIRIAENSVRSKNEELLSLHRIASHDLKAPLLTITTFLEFLEEDIAADDKDKVLTSLQHMRIASDDMHALLDALLWLTNSDHDSTLFVETTLQELVREALQLNAAGIKQGGVTVQVSDVPVVLQGKPRHLVRVFQNLIDNAVKFMGDQPEPCIEIGFEKTNDSMYVFVRDNGMGIDTLADSKIFEIFSRAESNKEGFGLGLAIVKRIVEMHGGSVWVESEGSGLGSCFRFRLPRQG